MNKIKWGVIGCGGIADRRTIPGLIKAENATLVAVMDTNYSLAKQVGEKYNVSSVYDNAEELLNDKEVDAVYIATPVFCHKEQAMAAICAGKHVLVEKPIALTVEEAKEIADLADKNNVKISVGLMMRFHTYHQKIKELIAEGKIDILIFFCDNLITQGHQQDVSALSRLASLYNIAFASNRTTADMIVTSSLITDEKYQRIIPTAIEDYNNRWEFKGKTPKSN